MDMKHTTEVVATLWFFAYFGQKLGALKS